MTVQEIQEIGFEKAVFGGYDMKSVDTFLERVAEEFAAMQKENAAMKAKMKVLVDKIEEYRGVEEGMHRTLLTAQSIAQETIDKAKKEAEEIIASAKDETANKVKDTQAEINTEEQKLETARKNTAEFIAHVAKLYQSQARALAELAKAKTSLRYSRLKMQRTQMRLGRAMHQWKMQRVNSTSANCSSALNTTRRTLSK